MLKENQQTGACRYVGLILATAMILATIVVLFSDSIFSPNTGLGLLIPSGTAFLAAICYGIKSEYDKAQHIHPNHVLEKNLRPIPIRARYIESEMDVM